MKTIYSGLSHFGKLIDDDFHCVLGSCVGLLYFNEETVGITHGRLPKEVTSQIKEISKNITNHKLVLYGGMNGQIGDMNINAARNELRGIEYEDNTGYSVTIKNIDGLLIVKKIEEGNDEKRNHFTKKSIHKQTS